MFDLCVGFAILLLGGACGGSFGLPSKFVSRDLPWENLWGPFFLFATLLLPVFLIPVFTPGWLDICRSVGFAGLALPLAFGFLWGLGSMTLGLSFAFIGLSLAYAINYGGQIIVGSMAPMMLHTPDRLRTPAGWIIMAGVAICLLGVIVCGRAGVLKTANEEDNAPQPSSGEPAPRRGIVRGMGLALVSGILCACYAIAFSYAQPISDAAAAEPYHLSGWIGALPATFLILFGGCLSSCLYCAVRLTRNGTWKRFRSFSAIWAIVVALVMAILHDAAVCLFGYGAGRLGDLGVSVGYVVFMAFAIIVGNFNGFVTGEWKHAGRRAVKWIGAGIGILVAAVCVLGIGKGLDADNAPATPESQPVSESQPVPESEAVSPGETVPPTDATSPPDAPPPGDAASPGE